MNNLIIATDEDGKRNVKMKSWQAVEKSVSDRNVAKVESNIITGDKGVQTKNPKRLPAPELTAPPLAVSRRFEGDDEMLS